VSDNATNDEINERMQRAVQEAASDLWPGDLVTRFIVIAEVLDGDTGDRVGVGAATPGAKTWDSAGLLQFGLQLEQAKITAEYVRDGGDD
jgi:hypothetical protein